MLQGVGFRDAALVAETGFDSSPKTKGVLLRATKRETYLDTALTALNNSSNKFGVSHTNLTPESQEQEA
jgi:hypothetical protein